MTAVFCNRTPSINTPSAHQDTLRVKAAADDKLQGIQGRVESLKARADELKELADQMLRDAARSFEPMSVEPIQYRPTVAGFVRLTPSIPVVPTVFVGIPQQPDIPRFAQSIEAQDFRASTISAPTIVPISAQFLATAFNSIGTPREFAVWFPNIPPTPAVVFPELRSAALVDAVFGRLQGLSVHLPSMPTIPAISIADPIIEFPSVDVSFDSFVARLERAARNTFVPADHTYTLKADILQIIGAFYAGGIVLDAGDLQANYVKSTEDAVKRYERHMQDLWARHGLGTPGRNGVVSAHVARYAERVREDSQMSFEAQALQWKMQGYQYVAGAAAEAHNFFATMELQLDELDFLQSTAEYAGRVALFEALAAVYRARSLTRTIQIAAYRARLARVTARASRIRAHLQVLRAYEGYADAQTQVYVSRNELKAAVESILEAQVSQNQARVELYQAQISQLEAAELKAQADVEAYKARLSAWRGELAALRHETLQTQGRNRVVQARNAVAASRVSLQAAGQEAIALEATASASAAVRKLGELRARAASASAERADYDAQLAIAAGLYGAQGLLYRVQTTPYEIGTSVDSAKLQTDAAQNSAAAASATRIAGGAVRAAQLTQQYRAQIADAYMQFYDVLARAESSRIAGELSGYRASVGLAAAGSYDTSNQYSSSMGQRDDLTTGKSVRCDVAYEELIELAMTDE